jgi:hypothetical protein
MPTAPATLHLCFGEADEDLLAHHQVFAEHGFPFGDGRVTLYVIGASSIVLVEYSDLRFAEMIACGPSRRGFESVCEAGVMLVPGAQGRISRLTNRCRYRGEMRAEAGFPAETCKADGRLPHRVSFRFPSADRPLTEIEAGEVEPGRIVVRTTHEYPEHSVVVRSLSRWDFPA